MASLWLRAEAGPGTRVLAASGVRSGVRAPVRWHVAVSPCLVVHATCHKDCVYGFKNDEPRKGVHDALDHGHAAYICLSPLSFFSRSVFSGDRTANEHQTCQNFTERPSGRMLGGGGAAWEVVDARAPSGPVGERPQRARCGGRLAVEGYTLTNEPCEECPHPAQGVPTQEACRALCDTHQSCEAWVHNTRGECYLKGGSRLQWLRDTEWGGRTWSAPSSASQSNLLQLSDAHASTDSQETQYCDTAANAPVCWRRGQQMRRCFDRAHPPSPEPPSEPHQLLPQPQVQHAGERKKVARGSAHARNVLLVIVDDLRPDLGVYGRSGAHTPHLDLTLTLTLTLNLTFTLTLTLTLTRSWAHTPHLDKLGGQGTVFSSAHAAVANCCPSRAAVLTGRRPDWNGVIDLYTHAPPTTLTLTLTLALTLTLP